MIPRQPLRASALLAALAVLAVGAQAQPVEKPPGKEKCFGVAKSGQNDCASVSGGHDCSGQARVSYSRDEWRFVPGGTCKQLKGETEDDVKARRRS